MRTGAVGDRSLAETLLGRPVAGFPQMVTKIWPKVVVSGPHSLHLCPCFNNLEDSCRSCVGQAYAEKNVVRNRAQYRFKTPPAVPGLMPDFKSSLLRVESKHGRPWLAEV
jgi:hypothetical protein